MTDHEGMLMALAEAQKAYDAGETPVGAVLVREGKIVARAHNLQETLHDPTAHAEMQCLRLAAQEKGDWRLPDSTLYVTLEPCPMCAGAMVMSRLGRVVYGASDPEKGCCGSIYDLPNDPALHSRTRWTADILAKDCESLLTAFFQERRQTHS
ncbi:MAG: tRNA adenosine(34) deaminase TadA [Clostridia bacterium]|nr:tRNA adenosine(34) deaminase TadA [Clostridia bacterium]MBR2287019.1 tRNA adenosine(34) deaminase TadA [Clostridia bacterium]